MVEQLKIPEEVRRVVLVLHEAGYEAYPVGGCVRDLLLARRSLGEGGPKDWDVATSAKPEEILQLFPESFYENAFLTVTVNTGSDDPTLAEIEITTFRSEGKYTDKRHPDDVRYAQTLEEDLSRRDFTMNAMALKIDVSSPQKRGSSADKNWIPDQVGNDNQDLDLQIVDPFNGQSDIEKKIIRAVGDPDKRFNEDALRMLRAVRFGVQLGFAIEPATRDAIKRNAGSIHFIAKERIRDELLKIFETPHARDSIELLHELGLLKHIMPELEDGIGIVNRPKILTVWEHNLKSLEYGAKSGYPPLICLAALLHDVGKPATRGPVNTKNDEWTFYGHDVVGAKIATRILERLHFPRHDIEKIATLIRWHLFKYDPDEGITDSSIRRLIRHVGADNMDNLVKLRICDRMGMGVPKALPYRLRHFQFRVEKILREEEAPSVKKIAIKGEDIMKILSIPPGPKIGAVLEVLLQEIIDDPEKNEREYLMARIAELRELSEQELADIAHAAESKIELAEDERIGAMKGKYWVK
ncbi:MAG: HD domain-containing protein [Candidatus Sungbacteria bacterium]|nr:HD domain-containing protein [Candidatus Sungbacteria bacterium]